MVIDAEHADAGGGVSHAGRTFSWILQLFAAGRQGRGAFADAGAGCRSDRQVDRDRRAAAGRGLNLELRSDLGGTLAHADQTVVARLAGSRTSVGVEPRAVVAH